MKDKTITYTTTGSNKYDDWITNQLMEWVRDVKTNEDALFNIPIIIRAYERRKTFKEKLKALLASQK